MDDPFTLLRGLAASDPRAARSLVTSLLDADSEQLEPLLRRLSSPGEGRLRQLVANAVRPRADKTRVRPFLLQWAEQETDEFARSAIAAALDAGEHPPRREVQRPTPPEPLPDLVDAYRYAAERLCHRVRNALPASSVHMRQIERLARGTSEPLRGEVLAAISQLKDSLRAVSRVVEFETGDEYFQWKRIDVPDWLTASMRAYRSKNEPISLSVVPLPNPGQEAIRGTDYLLETVFWNLWKNSRQAITGPCVVTVEIQLRGGRLNLVVSDNGQGLSGDMNGVAFEERYSTKGPARGRGLLEVEDAVRRMSGTVTLVRTHSGGYAVGLSFPREDR